LSADVRHASTLISPIPPEREPGPSWPVPCPEAPQAESAPPYIEPGGMVDIALRELGARLVRAVETEDRQASIVDLPSGTPSDSPVDDAALL